LQLYPKFQLKADINILLMLSFAKKGLIDISDVLTHYKQFLDFA